MTQNIKPLYEVDSGVFLSSIDNYKRYGDRIGLKPFLFEQEKLKSVDIDWPEDFTYAEKLWKLSHPFDGLDEESVITILL